MSGGTATGGATMWPTLLDLTRDECKRVLRSLELQAYAGIVSAFRAQGELTKDKKNTLQDLQRILSISTERHRAEVRRAVNDEKLTTVADHMSGPAVTCDWLVEGRRLAPLMPRLVPQTAFTLAANQAASLQAEKNAQLPSPVHTGNKDAGSSTAAAGALLKRRRSPSPNANVVVLPGGMHIHIKGGAGTDADDDSGPAGERRWPPMSAAAGVCGGPGVPEASPSAGYVTKAPVVTTKVVSPVGIQTPMKITMPKSQLASGPPQKLILVNAGQTVAGSALTPTKSLSSAMTLTRPGSTTPAAGIGQPKTSVVYPSSTGQSMAFGSLVTAGAASSLSGSYSAPSQNATVYSHSLTIARPRPKTVPAVLSSSTSSLSAASTVTLSPGTVAKVRAPLMTSTVSSLPATKLGNTVATAGPQPVNPGVVALKPTIMTSVATTTTKPGIQIKQEGAMKIITSSGSKILPKPPGSSAPIVVVTSGAIATTSVSGGGTPAAGVSTTVRPVTASGTVQISAGKVINFGSCKVVAAASSGSATLSPSVSTAGKMMANVVMASPKSTQLGVVKTATVMAASMASTNTVSAAVKGCTVIVQNQSQRQTAATPTASPSSIRLVTAAVTGSKSCDTVTILDAQPASAAVKSVDGKVQLAAKTETQAVSSRPSILAGLMQPETGGVAPPASASPRPLAAELVAASCDGVNPAEAETELWLLAAESSHALDDDAGDEVAVLNVSQQDGFVEAGSCTAAGSCAAAGSGTLPAEYSDSFGEGQPACVADRGVVDPRGHQPQPPQFDIFSSALAEAQIDLDPYEYVDEAAQAENENVEHVSVTEWRCDNADSAAATSTKELFLGAQASARNDEDGGTFVDAAVSTSAVAVGDMMSAVTSSVEYPDVSEELIHAIAECGSDGGVTVASDTVDAEHVAGMLPAAEAVVVVARARFSSDCSVGTSEAQPLLYGAECGGGDGVEVAALSPNTSVAESVVLHTSVDDNDEAQDVCGPCERIEQRMSAAEMVVAGTSEDAVYTGGDDSGGDAACPAAATVSVSETRGGGGEGTIGGAAISLAGEAADSAAILQRKRKAVYASSGEGVAVLAGPSVSWVKAAHALMQKVMKFRGANRSKGEHNASAWFLRPVSDDEAPGYSAVVKTPMDFGTIKRKLETGTYTDGGLNQFHSDMLQVRVNCSLYNPPEHSVRRDCDEVMTYYEREFERTFSRSSVIPPQSSSSSSPPLISESAAATGDGDQVLSPKRLRLAEDVSSKECTSG